MQNVTIPLIGLVAVGVFSYPIGFWIIKSLIRLPGDMRDFLTKVWSELKPLKTKV